MLTPKEQLEKEKFIRWFIKSLEQEDGQEHNPRRFEKFQPDAETKTTMKS